MKAFCPDCLQTAPFVSKFNKREAFPRRRTSLSKCSVNFVDIATARQYPNKFDIALSQIAMLLLLLLLTFRRDCSRFLVSH